MKFQSNHLLKRENLFILISSSWISLWFSSLVFTVLILGDYEIETPTHHPIQTNSRDNYYSFRSGPTPQKQIVGDDHDNAAIAIEIPGVELQIPPPHLNQTKIQIILPDYDHATLTTSSTISQPKTSYKPKNKGWILLLHACTHSALKFFSPSPNCPDCVGLSEELRIVRLVMEMGYIPIAISCADETRRCWAPPRDIPRIEYALNHPLLLSGLSFHGDDGGDAGRDFDGDGGGGKNEKRGGGGERPERIFSIGASSGGALAAELVTKQISQAAIVMVMSLSDPVVKQMRKSPKPTYFAPMPRDKGTLQRVQRNVEALRRHGDENGGKGTAKSCYILDNESCDSLPLTPNYLVQRVPQMTREAAMTLTTKLKEVGHIDPGSNMLIVDPTKSNWRNIISPSNSTHWLDQFALKPGYSPLAKALHRAWAFHEYCSEVVVPALHFFEDWYNISKNYSNTYD
mmetsp:Transcript_28055/g.59365  ORF Transcript_28055/g.59365 Transcript_28055/m.59365 type:complete len:458 (-) Transcript_28055:203-1576(-)